MPGPRGSGRPGVRRLSEGERTLWQQVARTVRPLREDLADGGPAESPRAAVRGGDGPNAADGAPDARRSVRPELVARPDPRPSTPSRPKSGQGRAAPEPAVGRIDRKTQRALSRGSVRVDARIDLHGMTQEAAYRTLRQFLARAHGEGLRHVLVITGKGRFENDIGGMGILRRAVPEWLTQPDLRPYVSSVAPAAKAHGGDGALYVRLSRPRRRAR